jgi:hypothetical protein
MNIRKIEFSKKVIIVYEIPIYAHNYLLSDPIFIENIKIKVRYFKDNNNHNYLSLIPIKDFFRRKISMSLKVKLKNISFLYKTNYNFENYKLSSIPTAIVIDSISWIRNYKIEKIVTI